MANAIVGTLILLGLAGGIAVPLGFAARRLPGGVPEDAGSPRRPRFAADVLNGVPSIVVGIFAYAIVVLPMRRFSALAGGVALGGHDDPDRRAHDRGAARASCRPASARAPWPSARPAARAVWTRDPSRRAPGIVTGVLVALARVAGETAPLLFTAFDNRFWSTKLDQPIASLTVQIYTYALAPYEDWHRQAWAGALVLIGAVLLVSILARTVTRRLERMHRP